jgi:transcriptional regulator with XRE-family HTH domain
LPHGWRDEGIDIVHWIGNRRHLNREKAFGITATPLPAVGSSLNNDIGVDMGKLAEFLTCKLDSYGAQVEFARQTGISPGTIDKWMTSQNTPNFENCLIIADYFKTKPAQIFGMAGKFTYHRLFLRHFDQSAREAKLHSRLQRLLDSGLEDSVEAMFSEFESGKASIQMKPIGAEVYT